MGVLLIIRGYSTQIGWVLFRKNYKIVIVLQGSIIRPESGFTIIRLKSLFKQNFDGSQKEDKSYWSMVWQKGEREEKQK